MTSTAAAYDLAMEGGGNNFWAILAIVNTKSIELPLNFYMAEALLQMEHGLMHTMWRPNHPAVTSIAQFIELSLVPDSATKLCTPLAKSSRINSNFIMPAIEAG
jgi:hypothetical protein